MADKKEASPLEELEQRHLADNKKRQARLKTLHDDLAAAEQSVRELRGAIGGLQQENLQASFAYDASRAELLAKKKAA